MSERNDTPGKISIGLTGCGPMIHAAPAAIAAKQSPAIHLLRIIARLLYFRPCGAPSCI
jgi:hypothetical protein